MNTERPRLLALRSRLLSRLQAELDDLSLNGEAERRLEGNLNVAIPGIDGRALAVSMRGLAVSSGAACASSAAEPSHVLVAIGRSRADAFASVRFGIGRFNTEEEIDRAAAIVISAVKMLQTAATSGRRA
jgi:cysteine desulfurase